MDSTPLETVLRLAEACARASRQLEARVGSHHGLGFSELRLLQALEAAPERPRSSDLAASLEMSASGVTRTVLPLEKRGIVRREADPADARASRIALTPAGKTLLHDATKTAGETAAKFMRRLSVGQMRQLERLLSEIG